MSGGVCALLLSIPLALVNASLQALALSALLVLIGAFPVSNGPKRAYRYGCARQDEKMTKVRYTWRLVVRFAMSLGSRWFKI